MRNILLLCGLLALDACGDQSVDVTGGYHRSTITSQVALGFQPGGIAIEPNSLVQLDRLRPTLPADAALALIAGGGPLAVARSQQVSAELGRSVLLETGAVRPDDGVLVVSVTRLLADACLGPGQPNARNIWPGDDADRPRFMPPGCATDNAIEAMVERKADLERGRPLPPGVALPLARAAERYYQSTDTRSLGLIDSPLDPGTNQPNPGASQTSGSATPAPATTTSTATQAEATEPGAGLLQGPLQQPAAPPAAPAAAQ